MDDQELRREVSRRLGRPFEAVQDQLGEMFDMEWEEIEVVIQTAAANKDRSEVDVIEELVAKAERSPPVQQRFRRAVIRWIGKPWRERENPWDRYKHRVPKPPPTARTDTRDLEEWAPYDPEEHE